MRLLGNIKVLLRARRIFHAMFPALAQLLILWLS